MPPVFWLAQVLATESEGRLKEAMAIMSLRASVYYAANGATYVAASALGWLLVTIVFTFLVRGWGGGGRRLAAT